MTTAAPPRTTSTAQGRRSRPITGRPWPAVLVTACDRCGRYTAVLVHDWLCRPCKVGGARWVP